MYINALSLRLRSIRSGLFFFGLRTPSFAWSRARLFHFARSTQMVVPIIRVLLRFGSGHRGVEIGVSNQARLLARRASERRRIQSLRLRSSTNAKLSCSQSLVVAPNFWGGSVSAGHHARL